MNHTTFEVRQGAYYDSVILMQLQKALMGLPGVEDAGVVMATPANREVLTAAGFDVSTITAGNDDLLIIVKGENATAAAEAIAQVDALLKRRQTTSTQTYRPRSLAAAAKSLPAAAWVLISVPGRYAAGVATEALDLGRHVFLYSDNVALEDEIRLKQKARAQGLLMMGPDCGTAVINGIGLGFANRVRRGSIGVVGASGTGLQAITAAIHTLGGGISQAIGTGGRDLKAAVGGITALQALDLLARDPQTDVIVLVSKPPDTAVAAQLLAAARAAGKPVVVNFIGFAAPAHRIANLHFVTSLHAAAARSCDLLDSAPDAPTGAAPAGGRFLRALFSGGTLAYEALLGLQATLAPLTSNIPLRAQQRLADVWRSQGHTILDMGEDDFTQGRLHPMMDNDLRLRRLRQETADPETGVIVLDVVLGEGAHPDPAGELAPAIAAARAQRPDLAFIALVIGTDADPQGLDDQIAQLETAGALVYRDVTAVIEAVSRRLQRPEPYAHAPLPLATFGSKLAAINVGLESFYDSLREQGATAVQVDWRPPAGGNEKMMALLAKLK